MGPEFLWRPEHMWPMQAEAFSRVSEEDPEVKRQVKACVSSLDKSRSSVLDYFQKCSSWLRLKKVVAWLFSYRENLLKASKSDKSKRDASKYVTLEEMERAEREIPKHVQRRAFPEEFNHPKKEVKKSSGLHKLDPFVVNGLLCVGGRLRKASSSLESKKQIILSKKKRRDKIGKIGKISI